jgi:hypothetical protein
MQIFAWSRPNFSSSSRNKLSSVSSRPPLLQVTCARSAASGTFCSCVLQPAKMISFCVTDTFPRFTTVLFFWDVFVQRWFNVLVLCACLNVRSVFGLRDNISEFVSVHFLSILTSLLLIYNTDYRYEYISKKEQSGQGHVLYALPLKVALSQRK